MDEDVSLRDYQIADLAFYIANPRCMNLSDPGTGKTPSVCVMQWHLWESERCRTIWVMPKSLLQKNKSELHRFTNFTDEQVVIVDGPKAAKQLSSSKAVVFLMGFRRFALMVERDQVPEGVNAIHVDEVHMGFGGHNSKQTQALYKVMRNCKYYLAMSGTLVNGRLDTVYPTIHIIEPRYYPSYESFMSYHAWLDEYDRPVMWRNHEKISKILGNHGIRRTFEMCYGKEAKVELKELVQMSDEQRVIYEELEATATLELEKFIVDGTLPGVNYIRLRQVMEHPNQFPDLTNPGEYIDILKGGLTAKEERIQIHLEDHARTGKPLVIFSPLVPQHDRMKILCQKAGLSVAVMNGKVTGRARDEVDEGFRSGKYQVIVCSPAVASVGFNWQHSGEHEVDHVIFAAMDPVDTAYLQAYRRFMRGVRETPLRITVLEYERSIDQRVFEIIKNKSRDAQKVDPSRPTLEFETT